MVSVAINLGVERSKAKVEMQRILNVEKELANVGESFILFNRLTPRLIRRETMCSLPHKCQGIRFRFRFEMINHQRP